MGLGRPLREVEVRLYDRLFMKADPDEGGDFKDHLNPDSVENLTSCRVEPSLAAAAAGDRYQFLRQGYFCVDAVDSASDSPVFNRTVALRDSWARLEKS